MATLLKGNCLEVMKALPDKSVDCFVCDLPYGCLTGGGGQEKKRRNLVRYVDGVATDNTAVYRGGVISGCAWDIKIDLVEFWKQVKRLCKNDNTPVLMFCNTRFGAELIASNPDWFRHDLIWSKSNGVGFLRANKEPLRSHELIYVFAKKGAYYKRVDIEGDFPNTISPNHKRSSNQQVYGNIGGAVYDCANPGRTNPIHRVGTRENIRCVKSVIEIANKKSKGGHPTAKPLELYEWLLKRYCPPDGTMLDPTAGSFNSVMSARNLGLKAIGIEMNSVFFWNAVAKLK
jgi:site-specific DNA-methyltransferase (adenine-specific)